MSSTTTTTGGRNLLGLPLWAGISALIGVLSLLVALGDWLFPLPEPSPAPIPTTPAPATSDSIEAGPAPSLVTPAVTSAGDSSVADAGTCAGSSVAACAVGVGPATTSIPAPASGERTALGGLTRGGQARGATEVTFGDMRFRDGVRIGACAGYVPAPVRFPLGWRLQPPHRDRRRHRNHLCRLHDGDDAG